jgi:hypothetical protein
MAKTQFQNDATAYRASKANHKAFKPIDYIKAVGSGHLASAASWELRETKAVRGLSSTEIDIVNGAIARHNERWVAHQMPGIKHPTTKDLRKVRDEKREETVTKIVKRLYHGSQTTWAGGNTIVHVRISDTPKAFGSATKVWNGKFSGNDTYLTVTVDNVWLTKVSGAGLAQAGGMLTTHATEIYTNTWEASWVRQGYGFSLKSASGIIVLIDDEYHHIQGTQKDVQMWKNLKRLYQTRIKALTKLGNTLSTEQVSEQAALEKALADTDLKLQPLEVTSAIEAGNPVDPARIAQFPNIGEEYFRANIENRIAHGLIVDCAELLDYPDLLIKYA